MTGCAAGSGAAVRIGGKWDRSAEVGLAAGLWFACARVRVCECGCVRVCVRACVRAFLRAFLCVRVVGCHSGPTAASGFSVSSCSSEFETNTSPTAPEPHTNKHTNKPHKQTTQTVRRPRPPPREARGRLRSERGFTPTPESHHRRATERARADRPNAPSRLTSTLAVYPSQPVSK